MQIKNIMEDAVENGLSEILAHKEKYGYDDLCTCERCLKDIQALALNRLPPRYVVSDKGEVFARASALDPQFEVDILHAILFAIRLVAANPRH